MSTSEKRITNNPDRSHVSPVVLVTGGSRGLGKSIALAVAERGSDVILTYRSGEREAHDVAAQVEALGRRARALALDVRNTRSFPAFADSVRNELVRVFGREHIQGLVNNAGTGASASFLETTEEQLDEQYAVHVKSTFFLSQRLLPLIADGGRIVNVSSGLSRYSFPGQSAYASMKGAVDVLTRYMAAELGARGITVNVIAPGGLVTDFGGGVMQDPELQRFVVANTPLGRVGMPEDAADVVATLLAPETRWVTGQRIEVTGGFRL